MESIVDTGLKVKVRWAPFQRVDGGISGWCHPSGNPKLWGYMAGWWHDILNKADLVKQ